MKMPVGFVNMCRHGDTQSRRRPLRNTPEATCRIAIPHPGFLTRYHRAARSQAFEIWAEIAGARLAA
jgi:hypothetical protein